MLTRITGPHEREPTVVSDPGTFSAPATSTMTTGATTSTSPGQPSVSAPVATPQIATTPTSAEPG